MGVTLLFGEEKIRDYLLLRLTYGKKNFKE